MVIETITNLSEAEYAIVEEYITIDLCQVIHFKNHFTKHTMQYNTVLRQRVLLHRQIWLECIATCRRWIALGRLACVVHVWMHVCTYFLMFPTIKVFIGFSNQWKKNVVAPKDGIKYYCNRGDHLLVQVTYEVMMIFGLAILGIKPWSISWQITLRRINQQ